MVSPRVQRAAWRPMAGLPGGRMLEWGVLATLVLLVVGFLGHYGKQVQGQAERAAVISTLGALRTAFVLDHIQSVVRKPTGKPGSASANPFLLLEPALVNYRGELSVVKSLTTTPGSWLYDPQCQCVGYAPLDPDWSDQPTNAALLWFKVTDGPGARQIQASADYRWRGLRIQ